MADAAEAERAAKIRSGFKLWVLFATVPTNTSCAES